MRFLVHLPVGCVIGIVAVVAIAAWALVVLLGPALLDAVSLSSDEVTGIEALATVAGLSFGLGAGILVLIELNQANDSRNLDIYLDIYEKMKAPEELEARRLIYQKMPDLKAMSEPDRTAAIQHILRNDNELQAALKIVLNTFDYFGFLVEQDWVTSKEVVGWLSPVTVKLWAKIGPLVDYERDQRPEEPDYYIAAVHLAQQCKRGAISDTRTAAKR